VVVAVVVGNWHSFHLANYLGDYFDTSKEKTMPETRCDYGFSTHVGSSCVGHMQIFLEASEIQRNFENFYG
jgi:hypothetical protein